MISKSKGIGNRKRKQHKLIYLQLRGGGEVGEASVVQVDLAGKENENGCGGKSVDADIKLRTLKVE